MSDSNHTPGPWFDWEQKAWIYPPHMLLGSVEDARLIAVAPELLEALETLYFKTVVGTDDDRHAALNKAWKAIAKAKGTA